MEAWQHCRGARTRKEGLSQHCVKAAVELIGVFASLVGHREQHSLLVQVGQPQHVGLSLCSMARLKAVSNTLLCSLWP
jgi:hypothetical protein